MKEQRKVKEVASNSEDWTSLDFWNRLRAGHWEEIIYDQTKLSSC